MPSQKNAFIKARIKPIISKRPRDRYIADLVDLTKYKDKNDGKGWLLVLVDSFSKFAVVKTLKTKTAEEVAKRFEDIFFAIGPPIILHTDNGREFKNSTMQNLCENFGVKQVHGRARAPWIQGQVERLNKSIKNLISSTSNTGG